jgi:hypothetical protein
VSVLDHPVGLLSEKHHAFAERVASHVTMIINGARVRTRSAAGHIHEFEGVGGGSAVVWQTRKIILTAKHVVEGASASHLRFFVRHGGKIDWAVKPAQRAMGTSVSFPVEDIVRCRTEDLACIVLSGVENRLDFAELPATFGRVPPPGGAHFSTAVPPKRTFRWQRLGGARRCT